MVKYIYFILKSYKFKFRTVSYFSLYFSKQIFWTKDSYPTNKSPVLVLVVFCNFFCLILPEIR